VRDDTGAYGNVGYRGGIKMECSQCYKDVDRLFAHTYEENALIFYSWEEFDDINYYTGVGMCRKCFLSFDFNEAVECWITRSIKKG